MKCRDCGQDGFPHVGELQRHKKNDCPARKGAEASHLAQQEAAPAPPPGWGQAKEALAAKKAEAPVAVVEMPEPETQPDNFIPLDQCPEWYASSYHQGGALKPLYASGIWDDGLRLTEIHGFAGKVSAFITRDRCTPEMAAMDHGLPFNVLLHLQWNEGGIEVLQAVPARERRRRR